jgi:hypothetical protein
MNSLQNLQRTEANVEKGSIGFVESINVQPVHGPAREFRCGEMMFRGCIVAILLMTGAGGTTAQLSSGSQWTGTWVSAPVTRDSTKYFANQTLRQILHTSVGGSRIRIRVSNLFGEQRLRIEDVHIAQCTSEASIVAGTDRQLQFGGHAFAVVPPGTEVVSDPVAFPVPRVADIAVSLYLPEPTRQPTVHPSAHQTSYVASGDVSFSNTLPDAKTTDSYYFLTGVDVQGQDIRGSVVTLGASITEGYSSTHGTSRNWPSVLAARLAAEGMNIAVLNQGISGNRLLTYDAGPSALSRFDRDVLAQPGVRWVIFSDDPINDLGSTHPPPTADELIAGMRQLITRAHEKHIQFFCSTLTPYEGPIIGHPLEKPLANSSMPFCAEEKAAAMR